MKTEKKVFVHRHEVEINRIQLQAKEVLPLLQNAINEAKKIELVLNTENFYQACVSPAKFAKDHYIQNIEKEQSKPEFAGRKMKTDAIFDQFEFPDPSQFEKATKAVMDNLKVGYISSNLLKIENGNACIDETEMQTVIDNYCIFATDENAVTLWNELSKISESLNKFNTFLKENHNLNGIDRNNISQYLDENGLKFAPQLQFYLSLTKR